MPRVAERAIVDRQDEVACVGGLEPGKGLPGLLHLNLGGSPLLDVYISEFQFGRF